MHLLIVDYFRNESVVVSNFWESVKFAPFLRLFNFCSSTRMVHCFIRSLFWEFIIFLFSIEPVCVTDINSVLGFTSTSMSYSSMSDAESFSTTRTIHTASTTYLAVTSTTASTHKTNFFLLLWRIPPCWSWLKMSWIYIFVYAID